MPFASSEDPQLRLRFVASAVASFCVTVGAVWVLPSLAPAPNTAAYTAPALTSARPTISTPYPTAVQPHNSYHAGQQYTASPLYREARPSVLPAPMAAVPEPSITERGDFWAPLALAMGGLAAALGLVLRQKAAPQAMAYTTGTPLLPLQLVKANASSPASLDAAESTQEKEIRPGVYEGFWVWRGYKIRYQRAGSSGPSMLLVHGFGANADHWRKNIPELGEIGQVWSIDLLGYGYSDKPTPDKVVPNTLYNFENWGQQLLDFTKENIGQPTFLLTNSVGGIAAMEAAIAGPDLVSGIVLMDVSLRMLHEDKQSPLARPLVKNFQKVLRTSPLGKYFFDNLATPATLKNVLKQAYSNPEAVTDELIDVMLSPGLQPGAVEVFLDFISYSTGPLPDDQLAQLKCPVRIIWGEDDPWEKVEWGREFTKYECVEDFIPLAGVGHCPQDEAPELVNPLLKEFVLKHEKRSTGVPLPA